MNITPQIAASLRAIDLSTEASALKAYEPLCLSPLLLSLMRDRRNADVKNIALRRAKAAGKELAFPFVYEALRDVIGEEIRHYVTTYRGKARKISLQEIKRRLAILLAKWEEETKKKEAGELPMIEGEGYGYIVNYAMEQGLKYGSTRRLSNAERKAIDLTAERILQTFEAYIIYSLSVKPSSDPDCKATDSREAMAHAFAQRAAEEVEIQEETLFANEWENSKGELTSSFEEETQFFSMEYLSFASRSYNYFTGADGGRASELNEYLDGFKKHYETTEPGEAADIERAKNSRYKEYINL